MRNFKELRSPSRQRLLALTDAKLLANLDAWISGLPANPGVQKPSPVQPKANDTVQKTSARGENTAILAAYAEPNKKETLDCMREIRRMEDKLAELYRKIDAKATHGPPSNRCSAARSEHKLPGNLETKPKPEIRQHLVTSLLDPNQPSGIQVNDPLPSQEKLT